ncbi:hypothetical protein ABIB66_008189 [Bradyrhizobium sp. F1.13.3]
MKYCSSLEKKCVFRHPLGSPVRRHRLPLSNRPLGFVWSAASPEVNSRSECILAYSGLIRSQSESLGFWI